MELNFEPLKKALREMEAFWGLYKTEESSGASDNSLRFRSSRAAVIKAFEFTYELSIYSMRRQLSEGILTGEEIKAMNFRDMLRAAADSGLIAEPVPWYTYREIRNTTSHTYSENKANEILSVIDNFVTDVRFLAAELARRNSP